MSTPRLIVILAAACLLAPSAAHATFPGTNGKIVFGTTSGPSAGELFVINPDGSGSQRITTSAQFEQCPAWSPDGTRIVYYVHRGAAGVDIEAISADGSNRVPLRQGDGGMCPRFSPDGSKIVFKGTTGNGDVHVMSADGTGVTNLTQSAFQDDYPEWSPDGTRIAWVSTRHEGRDEIHMMQANGSGAQRLTFNQGFEREPTWSPDGRKIAFDRLGDPTTLTGTYVLDLASGADERLTEAPYPSGGTPAWSPDGQKIAFARQSGGSSDMYLMNPDGSGQTNVTPGSAENEAQFDWLPIPHPVSITTGPTGLVNVSTATFEFVGPPSAPPGSFECRLDGTGDAGFSTCSSPHNLSGLSDGEHVFYVRYKPFGEAAGQAAQRRWTVDTTPPQAVIDVAPAGDVDSRQAVIEFHSTEAGSTFRCRVDAGEPSGCSSPATLNDLATGEHTFSVEATDPAGNTSAPVQATWRVVESADAGQCVQPPALRRQAISAAQSASPPAVNPACPTTPATCTGASTNTVTAGPIVAVALEPDACFVESEINGQLVYVAAGLVSVNGIRIRPDEGSAFTIDPELFGGIIETTGPSKLVLGRVEIPLPQFRWDGLATGSLSTITKTIQLVGVNVAKVAGLPIRGAIDLAFSTENGGQAKLGFKLQLPFRAFVLPGATLTAPTVEAEVVVSNDAGLVRSLKAKLDRAFLGSAWIELKDLELGYDFTTNRLSGGGAIELSDEKTMKLNFEFAEPFDSLQEGGVVNLVESLRRLGIEFSDVDIGPFGGVFFVTKIGGEFGVTATEYEAKVSGGVAIGKKIKIPPSTGNFFEGYVAAVDGSTTLRLPIHPHPGPWSIEVKGEGKLIDVPVFDATAKWTGAPISTATLSGKLEFSLAGLATVRGAITEASWTPGGQHSIRAAGLASALFGSVSVTFESWSWEKGKAVCFERNGTRFGYGVRYATDQQPQVTTSFASTCDVAAFHAQNAQSEPSAERLVTLDRDSAVVAVRGDGGAPRALLEGPDGTRIETPATPEATEVGGALIVQAAEHATTYFVLPRPAPGRWRVTALEGSVPITAALQADRLPPIRLRATVRGRGTRRVLRWRGSNLGGHRLRFVEVAGNASRVLFDSPRASGQRAFRVSSGGVRRRRIDVLVTRNELPRDTLTVARFTSPAPLRLRRVTGVALRRRTLSWRRHRGAATYEVAVVYADGTTVSRQVRGTRFKLSRIRGRARVAIMAEDADGRQGPVTAKAFSIR